MTRPERVADAIRRERARQTGGHVPPWGQLKPSERMAWLQVAEAAIAAAEGGG